MKAHINDALHVLATRNLSLRTAVKTTTAPEHVAKHAVQPTTTTPAAVVLEDGDTPKGAGPMALQQAGGVKDYKTHAIANYDKIRLYMRCYLSGRAQQECFMFTAPRACTTLPSRKRWRTKGLPATATGTPPRAGEASE